MSIEIVIVGCGGHGREIFTIIQAINNSSVKGDRWRVRGFVDDRPSSQNLERVSCLGVAYLGSSSWFDDEGRGVTHVVGIGDPRIRTLVARRIGGHSPAAEAIIHPAATVDNKAILGKGVVVFAGARITTNVTIGDHVHINQNATVAHDCVLGYGVSVNPLAAVSGECVLGDEVLIGASAVVLQGLHVGEKATVGAGACVVRDVGPQCTVKGVPAR